VSDKSSGDEHIGPLLSELRQLIVAYVKQETVGPIRGLGRFVGWGIAGGFLFAVGSVVMLVGVLRLFQTHTGAHFHGNLSWVPYSLTVVVGLLIAIGAVAAIATGRLRRKAEG
jgi:hypothetical protein